MLRLQDRSTLGCRRVKQAAELLIACLNSSRSHEAARESLASSAGDLDWAWLLDAAERHRVLPLVARVLSACRSNLMPPSVVEHLQNYAVAVGLRNTYMTTELAEVLDAFESVAITAIPFKGPLLAATVYGDLAVRQFDDLDFLIGARDVQAAKNLLDRRGYRLDPPLAPEQKAYVAGLVGTWEADYLRSRSEHHFVRSSDNLTIDLHLALADPFIHFPLRTDELMRRSEWLTLNGKRLRSLSPEDTLLMLCVNGAKDCWERLQRTCDVAALLAARPDLDAAVVLSRAAQLGARRMLRVSLLLARDLAGADLPELLALDLKRDATACSIARQVQARLFDPRERRPELSSAYARFYMRTRERLRDRLWFSLYLLFTPGVSDWCAVSLPRGFRFLYYLVRPMRLTWTYGSSSLRSMRATSSKSRPVFRR
jgi:hypothetical protein